MYIPPCICTVFRVSMDIPWTTQLLCHPQILYTCTCSRKIYTCTKTFMDMSMAMLAIPSGDQRERGLINDCLTEGVY